MVLAREMGSWGLDLSPHPFFRGRLLYFRWLTCKIRYLRLNDEHNLRSVCHLNAGKNFKYSWVSCFLGLPRPVKFTSTPKYWHSSLKMLKTYKAIVLELNKVKKNTGLFYHFFVIHILNFHNFHYCSFTAMNMLSYSAKAIWPSRTPSTSQA